jgi:hypothetical protein
MARTREQDERERVMPTQLFDRSGREVRWESTGKVGAAEESSRMSAHLDDNGRSLDAEWPPSRAGCLLYGGRSLKLVPVSTQQLPEVGAERSAKRDRDDATVHLVLSDERASGKAELVDREACERRALGRP